MSATHQRYAGGQREARPLWGSPVGLIVVLALSLCAAPRTSLAQPSGHIPRSGFLSGSTLTPELARGLEAFRHALRERGWVEGHNLAIEYRFAEGRFERLPTLAAELVGLHVDVIVTEGSEGVQAAQHATQTIPIVMRSVGDPVQRGFIASLARPGGNITGLAGAGGDLNGKRLELLKEALPTLTRVAVLWNPPQPAHAPMLKALEDVAQALGLHSTSCGCLPPHRLRGGVYRHARRACRGPHDFWVGPALVTYTPPGGLGSAESAARDGGGERICGKWGAHDVRTERA